MLVQHSEAVYAVRKAIIEKAKLFWKDQLKDVPLNTILGHTATKQKQIDEKLEALCIEKLGWNLGEQYENPNVRITYNTFLKKDD